MYDYTMQCGHQIIASAMAIVIRLGCHVPFCRPVLQLSFLPESINDLHLYFQINNVRNGDPCTLFDINYSSGSIAENASVPVCSLIEKSGNYILNSESVLL